MNWYLRERERELQNCKLNPYIIHFTKFQCVHNTLHPKFTKFYIYLKKNRNSVGLINILAVASSLTVGTPYFKETYTIIRKMEGDGIKLEMTPRPQIV